jgi:hypothetical protein
MASEWKPFTRRNKMKARSVCLCAAVVAVIFSLNAACWILHVINYADSPRDTTISFDNNQVTIDSVLCHDPRTDEASVLPVESDGDRPRVRVPMVDVYRILEINPAARQAIEDMSDRT